MKGEGSMGWKDRELGAVRAGDKWDTIAKENGSKVFINEV